VREESQIDEMRAALQGERERAEQARQRSSENVRALLETDVPQAAPEPPAEAPRRGLRGFFKRR
jgi:hypothetical protein